MIGIYRNISKKLATIVEGDPKAPLSIATWCREERNTFPWIGPLYPLFIMLSVKQRGIKYHFLSFWYDSNWDGTPVSQVIGEHSNR